MEKVRRIRQVNVMFAPEEHAVLCALARSEGLGVSACIRNAVMRAAYAKKGPAPAFETGADEAVHGTGSDPAPYTGE